MSDTKVSIKEFERLLGSILSFPRAEICKHNVALEVLETMHNLGFDINAMFVVAVVNADDELAMSLLEKGAVAK